jgi:hypothetical protein
MYRQDWIMQQIAMIVQFIARLVFKKDKIEYSVQDTDNLSETDLLYYEIERLRAKSKICEAEDLLFDRMDVENSRYLELAVDFYQKINWLNDENLKSANFSREEIQEGLNEILRIFGLPGFSSVTDKD